MSVQTGAELAADYLLNGERAKKIVIVLEDSVDATPLYMLVLDIGWAQSVIASRMYSDDAHGIAYALAHAFDCGVVEP